MLEIHERLGTDGGEAPAATVVLTHAQRERGRLRLTSTEGEEVRLFLERGRPLAVGERLRSACGRVVEVCGAPEPVLRASAADWNAFARACYHLGNRHVKMQIGERWLRITPDHVLREMLEQLGLSVVEELAVFVPEPGAYAGHGHGHPYRHG